MQVLQHSQHLAAGVAVQRAGGLVGQNDRRIPGQRPGNGDALLLAAGKLTGLVFQLIAQPHLLQCLAGPAAALGADVYENWTDVSGILMADPRIVDDPEPIRRVTYSELRELSYIGAQVLHEGTIFPVREKNIPLNIRNTNAPDHPGTMIMESIGDEMDEGGFITGIAGKKGFSIITIAKTGMSSEPGSLLKILNVLAKHEVNVEYLPSGIDNVSLVVSSDKVSRSLYEMLGELQKEAQPNKITVTEHIAIVAAVGRKMAYRPGVSGKIFAKLGENGVNIRMITQGPEELNIIVGVEEKDFEQAIRVLYNSFVKENVV